MRAYLRWWVASRKDMDGILRARLAHFYFLTIHPFEDGNGRVDRVLTDMLLAQDEKLGTRYYSLSSQIMEERKAYYDILEKSSSGPKDSRKPGTERAPPGPLFAVIDCNPSHFPPARQPP